jgi:potassium-transporting ATPase KdpC subunit
MSEPPSAPMDEGTPTREETPSVGGLREQWFPLLIGVPLLTALTGLAFPLVLGVLARAFFPHQADGSLLERDGAVVGSGLIGQDFREPWYFHPRPSAAGDGYDPKASGGTNLGPSNPKLRDGTPDGSFRGVRQLADAYRRINGVSPDVAVPIDAVTRSGSGLDPHISPANAALQVPRIARERGMSETALRALVAEHTSGRQFGLLGEPRVAVLSLNLALDRVTPSATPRSPP